MSSTTAMMPIPLMFALFLLSCTPSTTIPQEANSIPVKDPVQERSYDDSLNTFGFFAQACSYHWQELMTNDSVSYVELCSRFDWDQADKANRESYYSLLLLHKLFTSSSAMNCARGNILNLPYYWHWITPNPRHDIVHCESGKNLKSLKPPQGFGKYQSWADIDRTPDIFIGDLMSAKPLYCSASCDTFYTFGWCSEREMAFTAMCEKLGKPARVVAQNNHSWSDVLIKIKMKDGKTKTFKVSVDNTFDALQWQPFDGIEKGWNVADGSSKMENWYNQQAHNATKSQFLMNLIVPVETTSRIERSIVLYLNDKYWE